MGLYFEHMTQTLDQRKPLEKKVENVAERDRLESRRWFEIFENPDADVHDILRADFRLEELLLFTESETVRLESIERLLNHLEPLRKKEALSRVEEFQSIHGLMSLAEVLKLHTKTVDIESLTLRIYGFTLSNSTVVSSIAHQKFLEVLQVLPADKKRDVTSRVSDLLEATR